MEDLKKKYRKDENFVYRRIGDETILVPIKNNVGDMGFIYNLNQVAAFVWEQIDGKHTLVDINNLIREEFQVSAEQAQADLCDFVSQLKEVDAIVE